MSKSFIHSTTDISQNSSTPWAFSIFYLLWTTYACKNYIDQARKLIPEVVLDQVNVERWTATKYWQTFLLSRRYFESCPPLLFVACHSLRWHRQALHWDSSCSPRVALVVSLRIDTIHNNSRLLARLDVSQGDNLKREARDVEFHVYVKHTASTTTFVISHHLAYKDHTIYLTFQWRPSLKAIGITYGDRLHQPSCCWENHASWPLRGSCVQWTSSFLG